MSGRDKCTHKLNIREKSAVSNSLLYQCRYHMVIICIMDKLTDIGCFVGNMYIKALQKGQQVI